MMMKTKIDRQIDNRYFYYNCMSLIICHPHNIYDKMRNKGINFSKVLQLISVKLEFEYHSFDYNVLLTELLTTHSSFMRLHTINSFIIPTTKIFSENSSILLTVSPCKNQASSYILSMHSALNIPILNGSNVRKYQTKARPKLRKANLSVI